MRVTLIAVRLIELHAHQQFRSCRRSICARARGQVLCVAAVQLVLFRVLRAAATVSIKLTVLCRTNAADVCQPIDRRACVCVCS